MAASSAEEVVMEEERGGVGVGRHGQPAQVHTCRGGRGFKKNDNQATPGIGGLIHSNCVRVLFSARGPPTLLSPTHILCLMI